jgi:hypothetical protein
METKMAKMEKLREMAKKLRTAYDTQTAAEKTVREAQQRQSYWRAEIIKVLGQEDGAEFLDMLREQAGFLTSDDLMDADVLRVARMFPR